MSKPITKKLASSANKKKWLTLGLVGAALLLIPRRSSRQDVSHKDSTYAADLASNDLASKDPTNPPATAKNT